MTHICRIKTFVVATATWLVAVLLVFHGAAAWAGVSLDFPRFVVVGKDAFSKYVYAGSERGIIVYERDATGKLSFVQSLTELRSGATADPTYERCDGGAITNLAKVRGIVTTTDGWVYAAGSRPGNIGLIYTFLHEPAGLVYKGTLEADRAVHLQIAGATLYSSYGEIGSGTARRYSIDGNHLPVAPPAKAFTSPDLTGGNHPALASSAGLLIVPGHTADKVVVLQTPGLALLNTLTEASHGIKGPYWVAAYPPDEADFVYVAMEGSVIALRRTGSDFTLIGAPVVFPGAISLAISPDGKNVYAASYSQWKITTLARQTSGPDEGKIEASGLPDQTDLPVVFAIALDADGNNLYAAVPGPDAPAAPTQFIATFSRNPGTGELTDKTIVNNDAEPAYVHCTQTPTLTPTSTRTETPTRTSTATQTLTPTRTPHDAEVEAKARLDWKNFPVDGPDTADKDKKVTVINADPAGPGATHVIQFPMPASDCPPGVVTGVMPGLFSMNSGQKKKPEINMATVSSPFFAKATKKIPARCHIVFKAQNDSPGDRTFWNNTTTVEVDFLTQSTATPPEFVIESSNNPATIKSNKSDVGVRFRLLNHDTAPHSYKVTPSFAAQVSDDPPAPPLPPCSLPVPAPVTVDVPANDFKNWIITVARPAGPKAAGRCTLILSADFDGVGGTDTEPTNNSTYVVIDIEK